MQIKKYPNAILENYSKILTLLGLVLSLFIVYEFIQIKSYPAPIKDLVSTVVDYDEVEENIEIKPIELQEQPVAQTTITERILKVDDDVDVKETVIESTEIDQTDAVIVNVEKEIVKVEEEEEVVEDVPFMIIENVPTYPGCSGSNKERRDCFSAMVTKFVSKNFNAALASDLGLAPGSIQKIFVMFKINSKGNIVDIKARAPHRQLQEEAIRVVQKLPKMEPGRQRDRAVSVSYGLPIVFKVE